MEIDYTRLSSMTVFKDSIHIGSISPSKTIHLGELLAMFERSRIATENNPTQDLYLFKLHFEKRYTIT